MNIVKKAVWSASILCVLATVAFLLLSLYMRAQKRNACTGWFSPEAGRPLDINEDGVPDIRIDDKGKGEFRTREGWVSFPTTTAQIYPARWIRCPGLETRRLHAVLFLKADNGNYYKFCAVEDAEFTRFSGALPKSE